MRTFRRLLVVLGFVSSLLLTWLLVLADEPVLPASPALLAPEAGNLLYAGIHENNINTPDSVATFNLGNGTLVGPALSIAPIGNYPYDATLSQAGSQLWVAGAVGDGIVVIDETGTLVVQPITGFGLYPVDIAFSKRGELAYVSNRDSESLTVINATTLSVVDTYDLSGLSTGILGPGKMAIQPCSGDIYMASSFDDNLFQLDPESGAQLDLLDAGSSLWDLVFSPDGETLYVTDRSGTADDLIVIDTAAFTVTARIPVGDDPWGVAISPDGSTVVVANEDDGTVSIIDTGTLTVVQTLQLNPALGDGVFPRDVDISNDGTRAYVPSGNQGASDAIYVIDLTTNTVAGSLPLGALNNPNVVAVSPDTFSLDPIPSFSSNSPVANPSVPIQFTDTSGNNPTSWEWDFGDGLGTSTDQNPTYAYANEGRYTVTLTVTNECGSATVTGEVRVGIEIYLPLIQKP
ncbi:MAG: PKD domain-containing protein [Ardenticatenales bacterium]|nr:PKD domain-containing protein [Ardenticatenales bacterium]